MRAILFAFLPSVLISCNDGDRNEVEHVKNTIVKLIDADNRSDIKTVLDCYADSITFYPVGRESISGIEAIRSSYQELFNKSKLNISTTILDIKVFESDAYVKGVNTGSKINRSDSSVAPLHDNYIVLLTKNASGEWKISKLLWGFKN